jgi:hypothetical protein
VVKHRALTSGGFDGIVPLWNMRPEQVTLMSQAVGPQLQPSRSAISSIASDPLVAAGEALVWLEAPVTALAPDALEALRPRQETFV